MAFEGFRKRDEPQPASGPSAADWATDLLARLAVLDRDGFSAGVVTWISLDRGRAVQEDFAALVRQGVVTEARPGHWVLDRAAWNAAKNRDFAAGVIDQRIVQVVEALETLIEAQRRGVSVASMRELMMHATSAFEVFGLISGRGLAKESVWPVGRIMIWTVLELQALAGNEQANQLATTVIGRFRTNIGEDDEHALSVASALSSVHEDAGDWERAADVLTWVCAGFARHLGPDAEPTITAEINLANAYTRHGRPALAAERLAAILARHRRFHADSEGQGPAMLSDLARAYRVDGRNEAAIPYYVRAMDALAEAGGGTSDAWLGLGVELTKAYRETGDDARADAVYARISAVVQAKRGDDA